MFLGCSVFIALEITNYAYEMFCFRKSLSTVHQNGMLDAKTLCVLSPAKLSVINQSPREIS